MSQAKEIVEATIQEIQETTELFYQQKTQEAYEKLQGTLNVIMQAVNVLHEYEQEQEEFPLEEERLLSALTDALNAMQEGDVVLLADILEYDFVEYLQELAGQIS